MIPEIHVDLETLSTTRKAKILAIGACCGEETFYVEIDQSSYHGDRFIEDEDTVAWWEGRGGFTVTQEVIPHGQAIAMLALWFEKVVGDAEDFEVWANSPQFDLEILQHHFEVLRLVEPWKYWHERDVRTMKHLSRQLNLDCSTKLDNPHHALQDARNQRDMVTSIKLTLARDVQVSKDIMYGAYKAENS